MRQAIKPRALSNQLPSTPPLSGPSTFSYFPKLPLEIREQIWYLSLPGPRFIHVRAVRGEFNLANASNRGIPTQEFKHVWARKTAVPSVLHICSESRRVGSKHYELIFDSNPRPSKEDFPDLTELVPVRERRGSVAELPVFAFEKRAMVYVSLERDIIVTAHGRLGRGIGMKARKKPEDPRFQKMPISITEFKIAHFRAAVPRAVLERIKTFVATYMLGIHELFPGRWGRGRATRHPVVAIHYPFKSRDGQDVDDDPAIFGSNCGRDFINVLNSDWRIFPASPWGRASERFRKHGYEKVILEKLLDGTLFASTLD